MSLNNVHYTIPNGPWEQVSDRVRQIIQSISSLDIPKLDTSVTGVLTKDTDYGSATYGEISVTIGDGLADDGGTLVVDLTATPGLAFDGGDLTVIVKAAGGVLIDADGLYVDDTVYVPYNGATAAVDLGGYDFTTTGTGNFGPLNATGAVDFDSTVNIDSTLDVTGATGLDGAVIIDDTLSVTGNVDFDSMLSVDHVGENTANHNVVVDDSLIVTEKTGVGVNPPTYPLDIVGVTNALQILLASSVTDATSKSFGFAGRHYTNAEQKVALLVGSSGVATTTLFWGGGDAEFNAATSHVFHTAADNITTTGTSTLTIAHTLITMLPNVLMSANATVTSDLVVGEESAQNYLRLKGKGHFAPDNRRGGSIEWYSTQTLIAGYTYANNSNQLVFDTDVQASGTDTGLAYIDLDTGDILTTGIITGTDIVAVSAGTSYVLVDSTTTYNIAMSMIIGDPAPRLLVDDGTSFFITKQSTANIRAGTVAGGTNLAEFTPAGGLNVTENISCVNLVASGSLISGTATITASSDTTSVAGINILFINPGAAVVIGAFRQGENGQVLHIVIIDDDQDVTLEHNEGTANQNIFLHAGIDETIDSHYGGWTLVCDGSNWYDISHAKHV